MSQADAVLRALDSALQVVDRAERRRLRTVDDQPADAHLGALRAALAEQRNRVRSGAAPDVAVLGALVRDVAAWTPDTEIKLLAALGSVVQAARP